MAVSAEQLEDFHRFASELVKEGDADLTIEELLRRWRIESDRLESVAAINRGVADIESGRVHTLDEVDAEIRRRFEH